jgi:hypothetical protein
MLLMTNSYIVPKDKRTEHARLLQRFRQLLARIGCDHFECYEQVGANWSSSESTGRFVQIMRFRDRKHQIAVQQAERSDPLAQDLIREFCELINFPYQQQQGLFAVGFYSGVVIQPVKNVSPADVPDDVPADASADQTDEAGVSGGTESSENGQPAPHRPHGLVGDVVGPHDAAEAQSAQER